MSCESWRRLWCRISGEIPVLESAGAPFWAWQGHFKLDQENVCVVQEATDKGNQGEKRTQEGWVTWLNSPEVDWWAQGETEALKCLLLTSPRWK